MTEFTAAPTAEEIRPKRRRVARSSKLADDQATSQPNKELAKSKDPQFVKRTFYLRKQTAKKLDVAAIELEQDVSDVAEEVLSRTFSSVTFYLGRTRDSAGREEGVTPVESAA